MSKIPGQDKVFLIDTSIVPNIYRTDNPKYFGKLCIDFQPESVPTIASFETLYDVKRRLVEMFGEEQWKTWFPVGIAEQRDNGSIDIVD